ncbi:TadG family pilus assembly protein [Variovorax sp. DXTD-1]|uniref:TadG family pilus assembly protein n=1 Tax=Variovorax sp. DXTD-1 TaxID=2495592 RepID=UPI00163CFBA5|nr:TadG family pilus assembly protein [Variovorax sp. DXTD-1]
MRAFNRRTARRQRGSVVITSVIALSLMVIVLVGVELGYMFFLKRELQKTADLAALSGAQALLPANCGNATAAAVANAAQNMPGLLTPMAAAELECGHWDPALRPAPLHFGTPDAGQIFNAVRVTLTRTAPLLLANLPGNQSFAISVEALAAKRAPWAALNIRSTLATVDSTRSALLNAVLGGLLGGSLELDAVGWNGLVNTNLKLLAYLDQLAIDLGIEAGKYDQVLGTDVSAGTLIQAMITVLQRDGGMAQAAVDALSLIKLAADASGAQPVLKLSELLGVQPGTNAAGLDLDLQLFQLVEGVIQVANGKNALVAAVPLAVPGVLNVTTNLRVVEPAQLSAVGNPALAKLAPDGPDRIYVRTAQIRALISIELPALNDMANVFNSVTSLVSPVTDLLNRMLSLDLSVIGDVLRCTIVCTENTTDIDILPPPMRLDINLDAGGGESRVTDFNCAADGKQLVTQTTTAAANLRIGKMGDTAALARSNAFASNAPPAATPVPIIDIGSLQCTRVLLGLIPVLCDEAHRKAFYGGGLEIKANTPLASISVPQTFQDPPELSQPPAYLAISTESIVESLRNTLNGLNLFSVIPPIGSASDGLLEIVSALNGVLRGLLDVLQQAVSTVLAPLLDPLVGTLLSDALGINLAQTEVGARLSCSQGAELVY